MTSRAPVLARERARDQALGPARWPWLTMAFVAAAWLASSVRGLGEALAFERDAFEAGEVWRALTLHLVHPWPQLALADLGALLLLGSVLERRSRPRLVAIGCTAGLLASAAVVLGRPDLHSVQGSSALVAGMWTAVAVDGLTSGGRSRRAGGLLLLLWAGKTACELAGSWPTVLGVLPAGVESVAEAHLAGGLGGGVVAAVWAWTRAVYVEAPRSAGGEDFAGGATQPMRRAAPGAPEPRASRRSSSWTDAGVA